jgi:DNA-binding transcriptional LysR family regulator
MQMDVLQLYCDVAQQRSVSRAAEAHGVTQSAASQRIQALERELGVQLIDRSTRPLSLTAAGELYYRGGRRLLDHYERLKARVASAGRGLAETEGDGFELRGEVQIAAIYSAGIDLLNQVKARFEEEHPKAAVLISYQQPDSVYDSVRHEQCDFGIISYPQRWAGIASIPLREETMVVVVRHDHPLASLRQIHASQLADHEVVSFDLSLPIGRQIRKYLQHHCENPQITHQFDNIDTIKTFVEQSGSAAILPRRTVQREAAEGSLAIVSLLPRLKRPLGIIYVRHRRQRTLVKAFIEYLLKNQPPSPEEPAAADSLSPALTGKD